MIIGCDAVLCHAAGLDRKLGAHLRMRKVTGRDAAPSPRKGQMKRDEVPP